jgi:hypothetical protein
MIAVETAELITGDTTNSNGDRYWLRPFNTQESIERCKDFESRGTQFKVRSGLELLLARPHFGYGAWYGYLAKAKISPATATRRMQTATRFMTWLKLIPSDTKPKPNITEEHVHEALETICSKPFILHDFAESIELDIDKFYSEVPPEVREELGINLDPFKILGFNAYKAVKRLNGKWDKLTAIEQGQAFFEVCNAVLAFNGWLLTKKDEGAIRPALDALAEQGKTAAALSAAVSEIKTEDLELDMGFLSGQSEEQASAKC